MEASGEVAAADHAAHLLRAQHLDRCAETPPLLVARPETLQRGRRMGRVDRAVAGRLASDLVFLDQREDIIRCRAEPFHEARAVGGAERLAHRGGRVPDAGIHEPDIAPRPAMADALRLQHQAVEPLGRPVERRRQPCEPTADDGHIRRRVAIQRCVHIRLGRGAVPMGNLLL
jgi:hypothetical protein